ncbi:unnamed protein product, partial [Dovyalis caffra]
NWLPLIPGSIKINFDGAFSATTTSGSKGITAKDNLGVAHVAKIIYYPFASDAHTMETLAFKE